MSYFFENFPKVNYDIDKTNKFSEIPNILLRYRFRDFPIYRDKTLVFYEHNVEEGQRPDIIAAKYYGNATLSWIILLTNDILDPYYDWPLDYQDFKNYMREKYRYAGSLEGKGGIEWSQSNIHHYEWVYQPQSVQFDNSIIEKKFYIVDEATYNSKLPSERRSVSYYTYEQELNDNKRKIKILKKEFVPRILKEAETILR